MTPFQGLSSWDRTAFPGLHPELSYLAPLTLSTFSPRKPRRGDISSALGNAQGVRQKPTIKALKERNNPLPLNRTHTRVTFPLATSRGGDYPNRVQ